MILQRSDTKCSVYSIVDTFSCVSSVEAPCIAFLRGTSTGVVPALREVHDVVTIEQTSCDW